MRPICVWKICFPRRNKDGTIKAELDCVCVRWAWPPIPRLPPEPIYDPGPLVDIHGLSQEETHNLFTLGTIGSLAAQLGSGIGAEIDRAVEIQMRAINGKLADGVQIVRHK